MTQTFTTANYLEAIDRELAKRATTYPKIIAKKRKQGLLPESEIKKIQGDQAWQTELLRAAANLLDGGVNHIYEKHCSVILGELIREYNMRKKVYPRLIYFKRIDQATADYETAVWRELCLFFAETYLGHAQIALNLLESKRRKKA